MAVLVEAHSVIVQREAVARRYEGGWPRFVADAVNSTLCADSDVARVGFMHPDDVRSYLARLERHGLVFIGPTGEAVDMVVVDQRRGPTTPCPWIEFFHQEIPSGGVISAARLRGSQEKGIICPAGWTFEHSLSRRHHFTPDTERPNTVVSTGGEAVGAFTLIDKNTGEKRFMHRPIGLEAAGRPMESANLERQRAELVALWKEASTLILPHAGSPVAATDPKVLADVSRASELLHRAINLHGGNWAVWWALGVARRTLADRQGAYAAFSRAYGLKPGDIEIGRHLGAECLALGYAQEAVNVTAAMVRLAPSDAGLIANHALARLIAADVEGALREIRHSLQLDPSDAITQVVCRYIEQVHRGRLPIPKTIAE